MNLYTMLAARAAAGRPVRVGLIGAGKFGSMVLSQARHIDGMHIVGVADLDVAKARASLARVGWAEDKYSAKSLGDAIKSGKTCVLDDAAALAACDEIECIVGSHGPPDRRRAPRARRNRRQQTRDHGQRRSRRDVRPASCRKGEGEEPRLQHGVRRSAGHHLRAGRLGALLADSK